MPDCNVFLVERRHNALSPSDFPFAGLGDPTDSLDRQWPRSPLTLGSMVWLIAMDSSIKFQKRLVLLIVIVLIAVVGYFIDDTSLVPTTWGQRVNSLSVAP